MWLSWRLFWHTMLAAILTGSGVLAPVLLLLRGVLGSWAAGIGIGLLIAGTATLLGAALARCIDVSACSSRQWRCMVAVVWLLNPVFIAYWSMEVGFHEVLLCNALPLALALVALSGHLQLGSIDMNWPQVGCWHPSVMLSWLFSRTIFVVMPSLAVSFQIFLYAPYTSVDLAGIFLQGPALSFFLGGVFVLVSSKFFGVCWCVSKKKPAQAFVLVAMLSADWLSLLHFLRLLPDAAWMAPVLTHLLIVGVALACSALPRMRLYTRWVRALAQRRRARELGAAGAAAENLGAMIIQENTDSSESDEGEQGPSSLPGEFHTTMANVMGLPNTAVVRGRREWLCARRPALVRNSYEEDRRETDVERGASSAEERVLEPTERHLSMEAAASSSGARASLEIKHDERTCVVCLEEIRSGQDVRPLPRCAHKFHAHCLESWATTMGEQTRCPTCRRPALGRIPRDGSTAIWDPQLTRGIDASESPSRPSGPRVIEFVVRVEKDESEVGVDVLQHDSETLLINRVKSGPILRWNRSHPELSVRQGDRIVEVNFWRGNSNRMISLMRSERSLRLVLRRLVEVRVMVERPDSGLLGLEIAQAARSLKILRVGDGPFKRWNQSVTFDLQVQPTDNIIEVNGIRGTCHQLLEAIRSGCGGQQLELVLVRTRPPDPPPEPESFPLQWGTSQPEQPTRSGGSAGSGGSSDSSQGVRGGSTADAPRGAAGSRSSSEHGSSRAPEILPHTWDLAEGPRWTTRSSRRSAATSAQDSSSSQATNSSGASRSRVARVYDRGVQQDNTGQVPHHGDFTLVWGMLSEDSVSGSGSEGADDSDVGEPELQGADRLRRSEESAFRAGPAHRLCAAFPDASARRGESAVGDLEMAPTSKAPGAAAVATAAEAPATGIVDAEAAVGDGALSLASGSASAAEKEGLPAAPEACST